MIFHEAANTAADDLPDRPRHGVKLQLLKATKLQKARGSVDVSVNFVLLSIHELPLLTMSTLSELRILDEVAVGRGSSDCSSLYELLEREQ